MIPYNGKYELQIYILAIILRKSAVNERFLLRFLYKINEKSVKSKGVQYPNNSVEVQRNFHAWDNRVS